jgi:hypothetical protein
MAAATRTGEVIGADSVVVAWDTHGVTTQLVADGHRRLARVFNSVARQLPPQLRLLMFAAALAMFGLVFLWITPDGPSDRGNRRGVAVLWSGDRFRIGRSKRASCGDS